MNQPIEPHTHALAVRFYSGIQYCFGHAPRGMASMEDVTRALNEIVWEEIGPYGVPILARRDGMMIFDFDKSPAFAPTSTSSDFNERFDFDRRRYQYVNAFLIAVHSGQLAVTSTQTLVQPPVNGLNWSKAMNQGGKWEVSDSSRNPVAGSNFLAQDLPIAVLDHALSLMTACVKVFKEEAIKVLELCVITGNQFAQHQFESAHMLAWAIAEKALNKMWAVYQEGIDLAMGAQPAKRRRHGGRHCLKSYTAAELTQRLWQSKQIDGDLRNRLHEARRMRNDFAHNLDRITWEKAGNALIVANDILSKVVGVRVAYAAGFASQG